MKKIINKIFDDKNIVFAIITISFLAFLLLGIVFTYKIDTHESMNFWFGADTARVFNDLSLIKANHYRTCVHPLFVILGQPTTILFNLIFNNYVITVIFLQSLVGAIANGFIYKILSKLNLSKTLKLILTFIYMASFTNIIYTSTIETFIFAALFLILYWWYILDLIGSNKKLSYKKYFIIIIFGVLSIAITTTNIMQFIIGLIFLLSNKKEKFKSKSLKFVAICLIVLVISTSLAIIQKSVWPSSQNFLAYTLGIVTDDSSTERKYIDEHIDKGTIVDVTKSFIGHNFIASKLSTSEEGLKFESYNLISKLTIIMFAAIYATGLFYSVKNYKKINNKYQVISLLIAIGLNFGLHLVYGSNESFLYTQHFTFLIIIALGYLLSNIKNKKVSNLVLYLLISYLIVQVIFNFVAVIDILYIIKRLFPITAGSIFKIYLVVLTKVIVLSLMIFVIYKMKNKITYKTIGIALIIIAVIFCFSRYKQIKENEWKEDYNQVLKVYSDELSKFKKDYNIITSDVKGEDFFLFGMGNRKKILYKEGQLIDIDSSEVLYSQEIINDLILPHEYAVILKEKTGKTIKIYEDEEGVYILDDNGKVLIEGTSSHINLPDFKKYIYPNIMKVLHHEVLFNIKDSIPLPNIIVYDKPWYRDGMMMAMVLEKTNNVNLIKDFILNVPDVYDYQNRNIKEPDNLGQLLYMISLVSDKNHPLVTQVLEEAKKIEVNTSSSKYINGLTDFRYHPVYQTICLKYGLEALGIQNDYTIPDISSDEYMSLAWFHEGNKSDVTYDSDKYPYIGWAHYHTNKNGKIYISSSTYPLSWEKNASSANYDNMKIIGNFYVANKISPTHGWHASEMFLFLIEQI